jgi:hypothetical protein
LEYFGLKSLDDLPKMEDFSSLQQKSDEADTQERKPSGEEKNEVADASQ